MRNRTVIFLFVMISCFSFSQKDKSTDALFIYRSLEGVKVYLSDSLSYQDKYQNSQFFIDSLSNEPFTGTLISYYLSSNPKDSLQVVDGVLNGFQKIYLANNDIETKLLSVKYIDQNAKARISTTFDRVKTTHLAFYDFESHLRRYVIKFKKIKYEFV